MEQFDKDEKLFQETNPKKKSNVKFLLIGALSTIILVILYFLLKLIKNKKESKEKENENDYNKYPVLIADIGGTNVRLSLLKISKDKKTPPEEINSSKLNPIKFNSIQDLLKDYLSKINKENYPLYAVFGIPGPVKNNEVLKLKNIPHWPKFNGEELATLFNIKKFFLLNDFTCNGYGIQSDLKLNEDYIVLNDVKAHEDGTKLIIGPGTGLGMSYLIKENLNNFYTIGVSEGGNQDFTPKTLDDFKLREYFKKYLGYDELSNGTVLSGKGLIIIYKYLQSKKYEIKIDKELEEKINNFNDSLISPTANKINIELVEKGLNGKCELSKKVLEYFIGIFGDVAGDASLLCLPTGGLYLVGGLSIALQSMIISTNIFMEHYLNKDNFDFLLKTFPIYLVKNKNIGMKGATEFARRLLLKEN